MSKKEITVLKKQIEKLDAKGFDLEAWKKYTIVLIARIFGDHSAKIRQIESIEYEYNSWALRDTDGQSEYLATCKKLGKEILEASIDELEAFGVPDKTQDGSAFFDLIMASLEDELKGSQVKEVKSVLLSAGETDEKVKKLIELLKSYGTEVAPTTLAKILVDPLFVKELNR